MIFIWLACAVGGAFVAAFIEAFTHEVKEEYEEERSFAAHMKAQRLAETTAFHRAKRRLA